LCQRGLQFTGNLDWPADFQSLSIKASGEFGQLSEGTSVFQAFEIGASAPPNNESKYLFGVLM